MTFTREVGTHCGDCGQACRLLNEYGICAGCWVYMDDEQRASFEGPAGEVRRVVTYRLPAQPGFVKRFVAWAAGSFVGASAALAMWRWLGW